MDSRPGDETLILAVAEHDMGAAGAVGRVWLADQPDPAATVSWRTGTGRYRNVAAHARDGVEHVEPSLEDAYLLLRGGLPDSQPLAAGALVILAAAMRGLALPWTAAGLALAGNVLLGFAVACVVRTRTGEPGAAAGAAVVLVLMAPSLVPQIARWVRMFPAPGTGGQSPDHVWWTVLAVCVVAIAISVGGRSLPRWMSSVPGEATP
jgi:hypothetical protein